MCPSDLFGSYQGRISQIHLVADAVASRVKENREIAIDLLRQAGAVISSTEIVIFQWAHRANTENFRKILPVVK